jgi:hypothetical protein
MARAGSFNVPGNWLYNSGATTRGPQGNINVDQNKARKYFRGLTPDYNFSDQDLDILIAGQDIPGPAGDYSVLGSQPPPAGSQPDGRSPRAKLFDAPEGEIDTASGGH